MFQGAAVKYGVPPAGLAAALAELRLAARGEAVGKAFDERPPEQVSREVTKESGRDGGLTSVCEVRVEITAKHGPP